MTGKLWIVFTGFALFYLAALSFRPFPLHFLVKAIPIFCLSLIVRTEISGRKGKLLSTGFLFSAFGDIVLALSFGVTFIIGLLLFLVAHLFYISVFFREPQLTAKNLVISGLFVIYGGIIGISLFPKLGLLALPILLYLCVILAMAISTVLGRNNHALTVVGAFWFIISDSLIVINQSLVQIPSANLWIMITYYLAQTLIAVGAIKSDFRLDSK